MTSKYTSKFFELLMIDKIYKCMLVPQLACNIYSITK